MRAPVVVHRTRRRRALRRRALWTGGELFVTVGLVLMLFVVHQLWWTNREARQGAERKVQALEREWTEPGETGDSSVGGSASTPEAGGSSTTTTKADRQQRRQRQGQAVVAAHPAPSQAYAVLTIPRLSLQAPIAEGISKTGVLNKGYVGHYPGTAQPGQAGNFALAGHRNTHGEPFRHLNRMRRGDTVTVETRTATYTYVVDWILAQTSARDGGVIAPVPRSTVKPSYGYDRPGYYLTLTTCTPEFTSRYRLVVWGTLASARPR
ncbi:class E sortase [Streptomyces yaanensis]|uniref:Class E sortase n=1 Tax=Streptomyces yaanensis TaxID=1142239 RepID=A0ABV7SN62_9ACTN|nr:class E sortase [Streptomyces sp. CGMCC 4.7035]WNC02071.1 class E sortase [Streptomyces sp. CGMCC 4.7035]